MTWMVAWIGLAWLGSVIVAYLQGDMRASLRYAKKYQEMARRWDEMRARLEEIGAAKKEG